LITVARKAHFNAAHRLNNPSWSEQRNLEVFGKCNNLNYHGHNYELTVLVNGPINAETGFVVDTKWLKDLIEEKVISRFDHKNLNLDVKEFKELNPSAENIAVVIYDLLKPELDNKHKLKIILYETERNYVEYNGE
jgi:6-pyruvoyltetrahydropterin/6-carboxytetrahydropterin synthase